MNANKLLEKKDNYITALNAIKSNSGNEFVLLLVTDILKNGSYIFFDNNQSTINFLSRTFDEIVYEGLFLNEIVSRKKQVIPLIMENE